MSSAAEHYKDRLRREHEELMHKLGETPLRNVREEINVIAGRQSRYIYTSRSVKRFQPSSIEPYILAQELIAHRERIESLIQSLDLFDTEVEECRRDAQELGGAMEAVFKDPLELIERDLKLDTRRNELMKFIRALSDIYAGNS